MSQELLLTLLRWLFAGAALVAVAVYVVRPVVRMLREKPDADLLTPSWEDKLEGDELEIPTDPEDADFDRTAAIRKAREDPQQVALLVQNWLRQRK